MMIVFSLFPAGVLQLQDVLQNGYWHARSLEYTGTALARTLEWMRTPGDLVFIFVVWSRSCSACSCPIVGCGAAAQLRWR